MYVPTVGSDPARRGRHRRGRIYTGRYWPSHVATADRRTDAPIWIILAVLVALVLPALLL